MNAHEAREITESNIVLNISGFIKHIDDRIKKAALSGKSEIVHPFHNYKGPTISEKKAIRLHYENNGFIWIDHPNPDPGHPASFPYTSIRW